MFSAIKRLFNRKVSYLTLSELDDKIVFGVPERPFNTRFIKPVKCKTY